MRKLLALALLVACSPDSSVSPALSLSRGVSESSYIVILKSGKAPASASRTYSHIFNGYAAPMSSGAAEALSRNPNVFSVTVDGVMHLADATTRQNLDRIDQRSLPLDGFFNYDRTGSGVNAYLIDTGIRSTHVEFAGRVGAGADFTGLGSTDDCNGHGTHVAGILGGTTSGVAKQVTLNALRVIDCGDSASESTVIAAIDWATANAIHPAVVNMSLQGPFSAALNLAVANSIASGLSYVVAAGNYNADACNYSPASAPNALTVANALVTATGVDKRSSDSNWGNCVDLFAPGLAVLSAWNTSDSATASLSGTSMSSPHVAGVVAMYLEGRPTALPTEVSDSIKAYSTRSVVTFSQSVNCNLLFSGRAVQSGRIPKCPK